MFEPSYIRLYESGELERRINILDEMLSSCNICPLDCRVNRTKGEIARCYSRYLPIVSSYCPHFGEEPPLVGTRGAGNIFFGNCNLRCVYCQNYQISQNYKNEIKNEVSCERLAEIMIELQNKGCHNIGLVSPTHFVPQILKSVSIAIEKGLHLPLIYNTNAYDSVDVLRLLDGVIDIYLPDLKYGYDYDGYSYSKVKEYPRFARLAVKEMHRQVGSELVFGNDDLLKRGLVIRHLVLPNDIAGSEETLKWISEELGKDTALSIMSQYYPTNKADAVVLLDRRIRESEYERVLALLDKYGLENGWMQNFESQDYYKPDFSDRVEPFKR
ncbi:MAG TPA: radical SAM protein [Candidatus Acidoferrales bacterium]|nr:radical SAM protein [Candidatus Acidoferrales bacterium]